MNKTKKSNIYFSKVNEDAIVQYVRSNDLAEKTKLYIELIEPVINEIVDKIVYTYHFTSLPNIDDLRKDCKIWLVTILDRFDPTKGHKAFSYLSVIVKNWFIHAVKMASKDSKKELSYEGLDRCLEYKFFSSENIYETEREEREFWCALREEMEEWITGDIFEETEKRTLRAIKVLFESCNEIEIFNKKAIYIFLKEITGYSTPQIVASLDKIRKRYKNFKDLYLNSEIL